jgi:hypothetical protein
MKIFPLHKSNSTLLIVRMIANTANVTELISINQITVNAFASAVRTVLTQSIAKINDNIDKLSSIDDSNERYNAIVELIGLNEDDKIKVIKSVKTTGTKGEKKDKGKKVKEVPIPFWVYEKDGKQCTTIDDNLCHGLTAGLYGQCRNKPVANGIYCKSCLKSANENGGVPKRGNIAQRMEQFDDNKYEYNTPDGKTKKIYPLDYAIKAKFSVSDFDDMLAKIGITNPKVVKSIKHIPEKKPRKSKKSKENLTENMNDDDDDTSSVYSDATNATDYQHDDDATEHHEDDDVPFPPDDDEQVITSPKKSRILSVDDSVAKYKTIQIEQDRYAILRTVDPNNTKIFDIYNVIGYRKNGKKSEYQVDETIYGYYDGEESKIVLS